MTVPNTSQSLKAVLEQALLAKAAYANLGGLGPAPASVAVAGRLTADPPGDVGVAPMNAAAASYVASRFSVVDGSHLPDDGNGYSATLFAKMT